MSQLKNEYKKARREFKKELYEVAKDNPALCMAIIETYVAYKHHTHITKIWYLLGTKHREAYQDYCDNLFGECLTGSSELFKTLYYSNPELYKKYIRKIPELYAMGDALGVAYKCLKIK